MPKKVKFRKQQRGRMRGKAWTGGHVAFGDYGLKAHRVRLGDGARDRGRPHRHHPLHQAQRPHLDPHVPGQAHHQEAAGNAHGQGQGRARGVGDGGQARAASSTRWRACRRRRPARRCASPPTSCPSDPLRDAGGGQLMKASARCGRWATEELKTKERGAAGAALPPARPAVHRPARQRHEAPGDPARHRAGQDGAAEAEAGVAMTDKQGSRPPPRRRQERVGVVISAKMQKTVVVAVVRLVRHAFYRKTIRRTSTFMAHDELGRAGRGPGADRGDAARCRGASAGGWPRSWSAPSPRAAAAQGAEAEETRHDPDANHPPGGRQQRRPEDLLHPAPRRLDRPLRAARRRDHRQRQGVGPRRPGAGPQGQGGQGGDRALPQGAAPPGRQLHPLRRERGGADQGRRRAGRAPASSARWRASCATRSS